MSTTHVHLLLNHVPTVGFVMTIGWFLAGIVARNEIAASRGTQTGDGIALVGIILGAINVFGTCLALLCFGLAFGGLAVFSL